MFSVTSHRFSLMAPRAIAATREDAVACGMGLGSERPAREPRPMLRQPDDAAPVDTATTSLDSNIEAA